VEHRYRHIQAVDFPLDVTRSSGTLELVCDKCGYTRRATSEGERFLLYPKGTTPPVWVPGCPHGIVDADILPPS